MERERERRGEGVRETDGERGKERGGEVMGKRGRQRERNLQRRGGGETGRQRGKVRGTDFIQLYYTIKLAHYYKCCINTFKITNYLSKVSKN